MLTTRPPKPLEMSNKSLVGYEVHLSRFSVLLCANLACECSIDGSNSNIDQFRYPHTQYPFTSGKRNIPSSLKSFKA